MDYSSLRYFDDYNIFVCRSCQQGVRQQHLRSHFRKAHRYSPERLRTVIAFRDRYLQRQDAAEREAKIPSFVLSALPDLPMYDDGLLCLEDPLSCHYICRRVNDMRKHLRSVHKQQTFQQRGRPSRSVRSRLVDQQDPWKTVSCQRVFSAQAGSSYFEIRRAVDTVDERNKPDSDFWQTVNDSRTETQRRTQDLISEENIYKTSSWLRRTRWSSYLSNFERPALLRLVEKPDAGDGDLAPVWDAMRQLIRHCQHTATSKAGHFVRMEAIQTEGRVRGHQPLQPYVHDADLLHNSIGWQQIIMFFLRTQEPHPSKPTPSYQLSPDQQHKLYIVLECARTLAQDDRDSDSGSLHPVEEEEPEELRPIHQACLQFCISLLDQQVCTNEYEVPLICALALLGVREGGWKGPEEYPSLLSALMKISRYMVVEVATQQASLDDRTSPLSVTLVQQMVRRFMSRGTYTPFEWMLDLRAYGMKIAFNTYAEGKIDWVGEQVLYQDLQFSMTEFRGFVHGLLYETERILEEELLGGRTVADAVPHISYSDLRDNPTDGQPGWSFLQDIRYKWPVDGDTWLLNHVRSTPTLRAALFPARSPDTPPPPGVEKYLRSISQFRTKLVLLIHLTAGQPSRITELLTVRHQNSAEGEHRNVFIEDGLVCIVTRYHKGYSASGDYKVVHRYVPRPISTILVRYLWLVLPLYERLLLYYYHVSTFSPFLWPTEADQGEWDSERVRKALREESVLGLGQALTVQAYRHLAIAISRRFLSKLDHFSEDDAGDRTEPTEDDVLDIQAGHSSRTAGMIYARLLREQPGEIVSQRSRFRTASLSWHHFLGFPSTSDGPVLVRGRKRELSIRDDGSETAKRRWQQLRTVDPLLQLRQLLGPESAFRGVQREVITAVLQSQSPVLAILPTGAGKSLLYLLPASYVSSGTTVVIVPLISLRQDLVRRCQDLAISCQAWDPRRPPDAASVVLVTPESAGTTSFISFLHRLRTTGRLDRIVVDECHLILDENKSFRPAIHRLWELVRTETPLLFLTATLPPSRPEEFWQRVGFGVGPVYCFRTTTSRGNLHHGVRDIPSGTLIRFLRAQIQQCPIGRIVIYCHTVRTVQRIQSELDCGAYYSHYAEKARDLDAFFHARQRIIVGTSALGLGLDMPDVRRVFHVHRPRNVLDYAQESGRAGRDQQPSQCIIVREGDPSPALPRDASLLDRLSRSYDASGPCRRIVLDEYLDGTSHRRRCESYESRCDICQDPPPFSSGLPPLSPLASSPPASASSSSSSSARSSSPVSGSAGGLISYRHRPAVTTSPAAGASAVAYDRLRQQRQFSRQSQQVAIMQEGQSYDAGIRQLSSLLHQCLLCYQPGQPSHSVAQCRSVRRPSYREAVSMLRTQIQFANFSGCFRCGVPQSLCRSFVPHAGGHRPVGAARCQFPSILYEGGATFLFSSAARFSPARSLYEQVLRRDVSPTTPFSPSDRTKIIQHLGQRVLWAGLECNHLFLLCLQAFTPSVRDAGSISKSEVRST